MRVELVFSPAARQVLSCSLELPEGSTAADALRASTLLHGQSAGAVDTWCLAIGGRKVSAQRRLREGDRLEVLRPMGVDPKVARRERFERQGARGTGLFAKLRQGAKAGY